MNLKLSLREKVLVALTIAVLVFFVLWYLIINPYLAQIDKGRIEIEKIKGQMKQIWQENMSLNRQKAFKIYPKDEQLSMVVRFFDSKFKQNSIRLITLRQSFEGNRLSVEMEFEATYGSLLKLLNSLTELNTLLVIDNIDISHNGYRLAVRMRILSAYL